MMMMMWGDRVESWSRRRECQYDRQPSRKRSGEFVGMGGTVVLRLSELPKPTDLLRTPCVLRRFWSNGVWQDYGKTCRLRLMCFR